MKEIAARRDLNTAILDAADRLLARYGYQKMTMEDVAQQAHVSRRTLYIRFPSKEAMALACVDRHHFYLLDEVARAARSDGTPSARLRRMLETRVLVANDQARATQEGYSDMLAAVRPFYMMRREQYFENEARLFAEVLDEGVQAGELAFEDCPATALAMVLATNALMPFSLSARQLGDREEVVRRVNRIADLLLNGLRRRDGSYRSDA